MSILKKYADLVVRIPENLKITSEPTFIGGSMMIPQGKLVIQNEHGNSIVVGPPSMRGTDECTLLWLDSEGIEIGDANIFASFADIQDAIDSLSNNEIPTPNDEYED